MTRFVALSLLAATACTGSVIGGNDGEAPGGVTDLSGPQSTPSLKPGADASQCGAPRLLRVLRGLNAVQYENTIKAVLPDAKLKDAFGVSDRSAEFSTSGQIRRFDFNGARQVMQNADLAAATGRASLAARFPCLGGTIDDACMQQVVEGVGRELFHEPPAAQIVAKLVALFTRNAPTGANEAADLVLSAMLTSPRFLFRKEVGQATKVAGVFALTSQEAATAIAYGLTDAPPDAALRAAADADALQDPTRVRAEIQRLLATENGFAGELSFVSELYGVRNFMLTEKDPAVFPLLDEATRNELLADFRDTVVLTLRSQTPTLSALLTSRTLVVRPKSAALLGWTFPGLSASATSVVTSEPGRLGILTHPVLMATLAHQVESNPVARGHLVSNKLLCVDIPPPPKAVMFPERLNDGVPRTLRQTLESQHSVAPCTGCHQLMDPLGYPFEVFDGIGKLRSTDAGLPIDSTGGIPSPEEIAGPVQNVEEMLTRIASSETARSCFSLNTVKYLAGISNGALATCVAQSVDRAFAEKQGSIPELLSSVLSSESFMRRVEGP